jgi:superfamily II DNA or RNA helicase
MSDKRREIIGKFNAERLYGMSGTPGRANNQGEALTFTYGEIIIDRKLPQVKPEVHIYTSKFETDGVEYYEMEEYSCNNETRNKFLVNLINKYLKERRKILFLTKRIEHGRLIKDMLPRETISFALSSEDSSKGRSDLIQSLRDEKEVFDVLIGTYGLFSTGLDIPIIDTVILGMSTKVDGDYNATLIQSIGRCMRIYEDKNNPLVIDIDDNRNKIMHRHFISRLNEYQKNGFKIISKI